MKVERKKQKRCLQAGNTPMRCTSRGAKREAPISLVSQSWYTYS
jgi:hypothetical protein